MRRAFFKKVSPGVITLKINNIPTKIKQGQIFEHYFEIVHQIPGIQFVCFSNTQEENLQDNNEKNKFKNETAQQITQQNELSEKKSDTKNEIITSSNKNIIQQNNKEDNNLKNDNKENNVITEDNTKQDVNEENVIVEDNVISESSNKAVSNIEILLELKKKTNKEIFLMKKKDIKKIFTDCSIDFSHIPDTHIDLYKFLLSILQKID